MVKFIQILLEEIDSAAMRPVIIYEDNVGAMYPVMNRHVVGARTNHQAH
jgi:hypothetical protein